MTRKGAANFVRWKFIDDLQRDRITLQNTIVTHPDADHYGGLIDLLCGALPDGRSFGIEVQNFWHCGIGRFKDGDKLGALRADTSTTPLPQPGSTVKPEGRFIVELVSGKTHFARPARPFATELPRSVGLDFASRTRTVAEPHVDYPPEQLEAKFDDSPLGNCRCLFWLPMATDLVKVRSDGRRILCATMKESSSDFDLQVFQAGVDGACMAH